MSKKQPKADVKNRMVMLRIDIPETTFEILDHDRRKNNVPSINTHINNILTTYLEDEGYTVTDTE